MAFAGEHITAYTWHTVQHEGFHQFAHAVIGGDIPTWLNEGLAEYFGEALFTGGRVRPRRGPPVPTGPPAGRDAGRCPQAGAGHHGHQPGAVGGPR